MNIHTVQFSHILETSDLENLHHFLSHTAFVISHKSESVETLLGVLWYLPVDSPTIIVTNCPEEEKNDLARVLRTSLPPHKQIYLVHQKDEAIARLFEMYGVSHILGPDGKIINGKGEGMYIGALCAYLLGYPQWIVFYDADNFVPSGLLEYTLAMSRLFMFASLPGRTREWDTLVVGGRTGVLAAPDLHNVRICWSSKPDMGSSNWETRIMGRCTKVVSPFFDSLLDGWFDIRDHPINSSNAGEQGMTMQSAISLRFSSGFSVETFQLLDLLFHAVKGKASHEGVVLQQYQSRSPHFHEKKGDEHIKKMIEVSLGSFLHFEDVLPKNVKRQLRRMYRDLDLERVYPKVYPPLQDLLIERDKTWLDRYILSTYASHSHTLLVE